MNIVAIVGSLRKESFNKQLINTIEKRYSHLFKLELADIGIFPHYNEDDEHTPSEEVKRFKKQIADADAVIISTPEYQLVCAGSFTKCIGLDSQELIVR